MPEEECWGEREEEEEEEVISISEEDLLKELEKQEPAFQVRAKDAMLAEVFFQVVASNMLRSGVNCFDHAGVFSFDEAGSRQRPCA